MAAKLTRRAIRFCCMVIQRGSLELARKIRGALIGGVEIRTMEQQLS